MTRRPSPAPPPPGARTRRPPTRPTCPSTGHVPRASARELKARRLSRPSQRGITTVHHPSRAAAPCHPRRGAPRPARSPRAPRRCRTCCPRSCAADRWRGAHRAARGRCAGWAAHPAAPSHDAAEQPGRYEAADVARDERVAAPRREDAAERGEGARRGDVDDDVVALAGPRDVDPLVVDDDVGPRRPHERGPGRVVDRRHVGPEVLGELDREGADAAAGPVDQDPVPRADTAPGRERLEGETAPEWGTPAAAAVSTPSGSRRSAAAGTSAKGAKAPAPWEKRSAQTRSPGRSGAVSSPGEPPVRGGPSSATTPTTPRPGTRTRGRRSPVVTRPSRGLPRRWSTSAVLTDDATTCTSASPGPGCGTGTDSVRSTSVPP